MSQTKSITIAVNGQSHTADVPVRWTLADYLRHRMRLTGTHVGCEHGVCGACTVLLDGSAVRACLLLAVQANGRAVTTIEGLAPAADRLHALQQAFSKHHALQCGFCTPGMLMTLAEFLAENPAPSADEVRVAISGNLCRCTGYNNIVAAALDAAQTLREDADA